MFQRKLSACILKSVQQFPVTVVTGPRQSGKTTLIKSLFPHYRYVNLESPAERARLLEDPKAFLSAYPQGMILDEAQKIPELFSYIQVIVDETLSPGQFILSGSQNLLLSGKVSQSLAGRAMTLELLPLSYQELCSEGQFKDLELWKLLHQGLYPRTYHEKIDFLWWYQSYIHDYVEKDVRSFLNIQEINKFELFLKLCAGRHGQLLNLHELANDTGISHTTAGHWLSVLEASYICKRLMPYHQNFNKRLVKTPKLFFLDSAIVCSLLGIESSEQLAHHALRGAIFEGFIYTELLKSYLNQAKPVKLNFWRDYRGEEVDFLIEKGSSLLACEIKSSSSYDSSFLKNLNRWIQISGFQETFLIYGGEESFQVQSHQILSWRDAAQKIL